MDGGKLPVFLRFFEGSKKTYQYEDKEYEEEKFLVKEVPLIELEPIYKSTLSNRRCFEENVKSFLEKELARFFGILPRELFFIDEDGDRIVLDTVDSYIEAIKCSTKMGKLVIMADAVKQECVKVPTATSKGSDRKITEWLQNEMEKMKRELKTEILTEIGKSNAPAAVGSNTLETSSESKRQIAAKRAYGDYIAHALQHGEIATGTTSGNLVQPPQSQAIGGARPKTKSGRGDYISRSLKTGLLSDTKERGEAVSVQKLTDVRGIFCDECHEQVGQPYYTCLHQDCMIAVCRNCENRHPVGHAMLRLPCQLDGSRRSAAAAARSILLSMPASKQHRPSGEKARKTGKADLERVKSRDKFAAKYGTIDVVINDAGLAVVTWRIVNTGKKSWENDVKLLCLACSDAELKPVSWDISIPPLKAGADTYVDVKLTPPARPGEYKTYWMLARRGKRLADLDATIVVPKTAVDSSNIQCRNDPVLNVGVEHSYAVAQNEVRENPANSDESFDRIENQPKMPEDDDHSLVSGVTECKSTAVEQDYDIIPDGDVNIDFDSSDEAGELDTSYVSIASPVLIEENVVEASEMWQRLSLSLSSLAASTARKSAETGVVADVDVEIEDDAVQSTVEIVEKKENTQAVEPVEAKSSDVPPALDGELIEQDVSSNTLGSNVQSTDDDDCPLQENSNEAKPTRESHLSGSGNKRQQFSDTMTNAISNALLTTTQTLATVGAAAKEIHTAASAIVRTNFQGNTRNWQPPRAWVPKSTQTQWNPPESDGITSDKGTEAAVPYNPYSSHTTRLVEMGFFDLEKNERMLRENNGNLDRVILALLDEAIDQTKRIE